ncbi:FAD-dependent oxidoreductase [Stenotrophomonas mori]|uniref:FAD-dependent oxidoreductase n=1 Tax=Stenotrophomonas mori TaxID=2871096 RepID=A0ABT0SJ20_9GAMM|nr:FAD-dependent oxidoreductase [Stenotrophomonas mori]MCL7715093.1 FAD-dependent oxidoreductase [Stenotrophomonas mori]
MQPLDTHGEPAGADLVVVGAGVVGLATAYAAARRGLSVLLLDRSEGPVQGTSFANGAQLSYAYTDAMAGPSTWKQLPSMLFGRDGAFRTRWSADPDFWRWGLSFLRQTSAARLQANTLATLELALESRTALHALLQRHPIPFYHATSGKLHVYHDAQALQGARAMMAVKRPFGVEQHLLDAGQAIAAEPALAAMPGIAGAVHSPQEEAGDPFLFGVGLLQVLQKHYDVRTRFGFDLRHLQRRGREWLLQSCTGEAIQARRVVVCTGIDGAALLRPLGVRVPLMAIKGYSFTAPCGANAPTASITDTSRKLVFCRLGDRIRVAGLADLNHWDPKPDPARMEQLIAMARASMPEAADYALAANRWAGLRPVLPWSSPMIANVGDGLVCNLGHGMLGWTLAMGSGERALALAAAR